MNGFLDFNRAVWPTIHQPLSVSSFIDAAVTAVPGVLIQKRSSQTRKWIVVNLLTSSIRSSDCWARFTIFVRISEHPPKQEKEPAAIDEIGKSWCIQKSWLTQHHSTKLADMITFINLQIFLASRAYECQLVWQNIFQICPWISHAWLNILIATTKPPAATWSRCSATCDII